MIHGKVFSFVIITILLGFALYGSPILGENSVTRKDGAQWWLTYSDMPTARFGLTCSVVNDSIYAIGGIDGDMSLASVECFDPATDSWSTKTDMPTKRSHLGSAVVDDRIYVIGGKKNDAGTEYLSTTECYDPETDNWTARADMPTARESPVCSVFNGSIYAIGGYYYDQPLSVVECYDTISDSWTVKEPMPEVSRVFACTMVRGIIYVITENTIEVFSPTTDSWTHSVNRTSTHTDLTACTIDSMIFLIGGVESDKTNWINDTSTYDPDTNSWENRENMPTARASLATSVMDGRIFAIGGRNGNGAVSTVECYTGGADDDADGVANEKDFFMEDPAASADADRDGLPEAWNKGMNETDSLLGLRLDDFPFDRAASKDRDGDGSPDEWNEGQVPENSTGNLTLDAFPDDLAASIDTDRDGYPDQWNEGAGPVKSTTGLFLDDFPFDPTEWNDTDGDGFGDNIDAFPVDHAASLDSDKDGAPDGWNLGMTEATSTTGLSLDAFPDDPDEQEDSDWPFGDGVGDNGDWLPVMNNYFAYAFIIIFITVAGSIIFLITKRRKERDRERRIAVAKEHEEASRLDKAINIYRELGMSRDLKRTLGMKAKVLEGEGKCEKAVKIYRIAGMKKEAQCLREKLDAKVVNDSALEDPGDDEGIIVSMPEERRPHSYPGVGVVRLSSSYKRKLAGLRTKPVTSNVDDLLPRYNFKGLIGSGGFASVYKVEDPSEREMALKLPKFLDERIDYTTLRKYKKEGSILSTLEHRNIVKFYPSDTVSIPILASELLEGGSLRHLMKKRRLSVGEATNIMLQILDGLSYAHRMGIIHLDLKPENILFTKNGTPKITDWGIGKYMALPVEGQDLGSKGTVSYCAPEQFDRERYHDADWRTDIFQAGIVFYEMLTGTNPFHQKEKKNVMRKILRYYPDPPSSENPKVPEVLDAIVMRALEKRKTDRWRSADIMYDKLREIAS